MVAFGGDQGSEMDPDGRVADFARVKMQMKFIIAAMVMTAFCLGAAQAQQGQWQKPELMDCATSKNKKCKQINYCLSSITDSCAAHVGGAAQQHGGQFLLHKCFDEKMVECLKAVAPGAKKRSTNPTDNPQGWDCIMSDGSKADDQYCRNVNYCFDSTAMSCAEKIGARRYTPEGQYELLVCNKEKQIGCMRAVN